MAFNQAGWSISTASMGYSDSIDFTTGLPTAPRLGGMRTVTYYSATDTKNQILAANYFVSQAMSLAIGDLIEIVAADGQLKTVVTFVNVGVGAKILPPVAAVPPSVTIAPISGQIVTDRTFVSDVQLLSGTVYPLGAAFPTGYKGLLLSMTVTHNFVTAAFGGGATLAAFYTGGPADAVSSTIPNTLLAATVSSVATAICDPLNTVATPAFGTQFELHASAQPTVGGGSLVVDTVYALVQL